MLGRIVRRGMSMVRMGRPFTTDKEAVDNYAFSKEYLEQIHSTAQLSNLNKIRREYQQKNDVESFKRYAEALNVVGFHSEAKRLTTIKVRNQLFSNPTEALKLLYFRRGLKVISNNEATAD